MEEATYQPALDTHLITLSMVYERIDEQGTELFLTHTTDEMTAFWERFRVIREKLNAQGKIYIRDI